MHVSIYNVKKNTASSERKLCQSRCGVCQPLANRAETLTKNPEKIEMKRSMTHDYWGEQRLTVFANINYLKDKVHPYRVNESE